METKAEKTHLCPKGKYHCRTDIQFDPFGFSSFANAKINNRFTCLIESKPVKQEAS